MPSEYIKYQLKDVKPAEKPPELTPKEKRKNWLYYHKWYLIIGAVLIGILLDLGISAIRAKKNAPDYQIAYIGNTPLPQDTVTALTEALEVLGTDETGNGKVDARFNSYLRNEAGGARAENLEYAAASEVKLIGDLESCESYFFIIDDPDRIQADFQVLAAKDGSITDPETQAEGESSTCYAVPLSECSAFSDAMEGSYNELVSGETISGQNRDVLEGLYLARRGFTDGRECAHKEACDRLWEKLTS